MSSCKFEKYFSEYIRGELSESLNIDFQKHLIHCKTCELNLNEHYSIYRSLIDYKRVEPNEDYVKEYHNNLENKFALGSDQNKIIKKILPTFWDKFPRIRLAAITLILVIGLVVTWHFINQSPKQVIVDRMKSFQLTKPLSKTDLEKMNYFLLASEMILLEMENSDKDEILNADDFYLNRESAQILLMKTFLIHEVALQLNNTQLLRFLSKMEILLYEISNLNNEEIVESLDSIKMIIKEANLIDEVKKLQSIVANSRTMSGI